MYDIEDKCGPNLMHILLSNSFAGLVSHVNLMLERYLLRFSSDLSETLFLRLVKLSSTKGVYSFSFLGGKMVSF